MVNPFAEFGFSNGGVNCFEYFNINELIQFALKMPFMMFVCIRSCDECRGLCGLLNPFTNDMPSE